MNFIRAFATAVALVLTMAPAAPVLAQNAGAGAGNVNISAPSNANRKPEQNWLKVCDLLDDGQKACIMRQVVFKDGRFLGSFMLRDDPGQESRLFAVAAVPLGVMLPFQMRWQIDNNRPIMLPFVLCDPASCAAQRPINEAYVNSLKKGAKLQLIAKTQKGADLVVEINLAGFSAVYDGDDYVSFDQFRQQTSGAGSLQQSLDNRAGQMRDDITGDQAAPSN